MACHVRCGWVPSGSSSRHTWGSTSRPHTASVSGLVSYILMPTDPIRPNGRMDGCTHMLIYIILLQTTTVRDVGDFK